MNVRTISDLRTKKNLFMKHNTRIRRILCDKEKPYADLSVLEFIISEFSNVKLSGTFCEF